jgi:hypothetical protein
LQNLGSWKARFRSQKRKSKCCHVCWFTRFVADYMFTCFLFTLYFNVQFMQMILGCKLTIPSMYTSIYHLIQDLYILPSIMWLSLQLLFVHLFSKKKCIYTYWWLFICFLNEFRIWENHYLYKICILSSEEGLEASSSMCWYIQSWCVWSVEAKCN